VASFSEKRYPTVQQKYALILQNRNTDVNIKKPFLNINDSNVNLTAINDLQLMDMYTQAQHFPENKKVNDKKTGKIVKTTRNHQLIDKLSSRRSKPLMTLVDQNITFDEKKKRANRKNKAEGVPQDLSTAISLGQKMITKFNNKRSRMKCNNLFTSSTTPTGGTKQNSLKTTMNSSVAQNQFKMNKSFLNKMGKVKQ
jgi:hypothetical protein